MELKDLVQKYKAATSFFSVFHSFSNLPIQDNLISVIEELQKLLFNENLSEEEIRAIQVLIGEYKNLQKIAIGLLQNNLLNHS